MLLAWKDNAGSISIWYTIGSISACFTSSLFWFFPAYYSHWLIFIFQSKTKPKRVKAIYNCVADNPDELTFSEGDIIVVDGEEDQEWWVSISYFLSTYFEINEI